jgi:ADP-heptose:LPS heptosyltransferase
MKTVRAMVRGALLLPVLPIVFRVWAAALRMLGGLPRVQKRNDRPQRVLVVNVTPHVGDIVMMLPLLDKLHAENPAVAIQVAVAKPMGSLLRQVAYLEAVHELDAGGAPSLAEHYARVARYVRYAMRSFAATHYDVCLIARWGTDPFGSAYLAYLTDAPVRCGYDPREEQSVSETFTGTRLLMTRAMRGGQGMTESVRQMRLLAECGLGREIDEDAERWTTPSLLAMAKAADTPELWARLGLDPNVPFGVMAAGASAEFRKWPVKYFAETARLLRAKYGFGFVAVGSAAEQEMGAELERVSDGVVRSLVGKTSLLETAAVFARAEMFLGNDSGPGHIAAGLGTRTVVISVWPETNTMEGPSSPLRVRPAGPRVQVIQPRECAVPCISNCTADGPHCILDIRPEDVVLRVETMLEPRA